MRRAEAADLRRDTALDIALALMVGGFIGARFFHAVFEAPSIYLDDPLQLIRVWEGGFVWYGGALAGAGAAIWIVRRRGWPLAPWLDLFAPMAAAGYAGGRVACLLTGCCFGAVGRLPSGLEFRYPTQAFAVLWEASAAALLLTIEKRRERIPAAGPWGWLRAPGALFAAWLALHAGGRIIMEIFRADDRGPDLWGFSVSTAISLVLLISALFWIRRLRAADGT